jgi:two-component system response regulator YesN
MLQELFLNACEALETRFWKGSGTLTLYKPNCLGEDMKSVLSEETLNKITLNLKLSNIQTALAYVESVSNSLENSNSYIKPLLVKEFFWQFLQSIIIMLNIQLPFIRHEAMVTGEQPYERIKETLFMSSLESCVKELLQRVFRFYHDKNPLDNNNLIKNAKKVIEKSFAGDISLEQVAKHVHLSPAYLSELFKKETGMSFIDYKTIIRIEHAKKLLCTHSLNISEVSVKVGYSDPKYFSKLFKKITGKTIYEYKKEARNIPL